MMTFSMMIMSFWLMLISMKLLFSKTLISINFPILFLSSYNMSINIILDWMSSLFSSIVLLISSIVLLYSYYYIPKKEFKRFSILLFLFVFSMLLMILSNNIFFMMLGWDGLGITSYIMVIFYQDYNSNNSGTLTIFSNRLGDTAILLSISSLLTMGNLNFSMNFNFPKISIFLILMASFSKSAQIPLSAWLPAAMAAPTPISALVHSSTLVTAGVFIMIRIFKNFHPSSSFLLLFASISTLMISSTCASWEQDLKKIIAFSTLSQISMMMFIISINAMKAAFFHLITHALFKSTMFLCAGMIIHKSNYQDSRLQSFNFINNNWMLSIMGISSMALMGLPFLSGFFSKDLIIETALFSNLNSTLISMMLISLGMTTCYSTRLSLLLSKLMYKKKTDNFLNFSLPLLISINTLCPFSIFMGFYLSWILPFQNTLIISPPMKISISLFILLGMSISFSLFWNKKKMILFSENFMTIWFLKHISIFSSSKMPKMGFNSLFFDNSWMEMMIVNNPLNSMINFSKNLYIIFSAISMSLMLLIIIIFTNK